MTKNIYSQYSCFWDVPAYANSFFLPLFFKTKILLLPIVYVFFFITGLKIKYIHVIPFNTAIYIHNTKDGEPKNNGTINCNRFVGKNKFNSIIFANCSALIQTSVVTNWQLQDPSNFLKVNSWKRKSLCTLSVNASPDLHDGSYTNVHRFYLKAEAVYRLWYVK